ncbi:double zinc ribbon domain-containing protein [Luteolibacter sp. Populi]|uniref:double zinc ribbon domain-containing protein n=1 Tax=Luteolibacter sp. Populi TaxID=3230487 RepID=UPI003466F435
MAEAASPSVPESPPRGWWARCLDLFYPSVCHACGKATPGDDSLCEDCRAAIPSLQSPFCLRCAEEFDGMIETDFECSNCRSLDFDFAFARPAIAHHEVVLKMIHELKYQRRIHLAPELGRLAARSFAEDPRLLEALDGKWPLVPVPLHRRRQLWRHFNQAEEVARPIARLTGLPFCRALSRQRGTGSQTRLSRAERLKNLRGAFALSGAGERFFAAHPAGAVLVDDVFTTGATTNECARVLRRAGVQKVVVVTVMRG